MMPEPSAGPPEPKPPRVLPPRSVTVRCRRDGPLVIEVSPDCASLGIALRITDHEGREHPLPAGDRPVALCRCGQSARKPFCDGTHKAQPFEASETAPAPPAADPADDTADLKRKPLP